MAGRSGKMQQLFAGPQPALISQHVVSGPQIPMRGVQPHFPFEQGCSLQHSAAVVHASFSAMHATHASERHSDPEQQVCPALQSPPLGLHAQIPPRQSPEQQSEAWLQFDPSGLQQPCMPHSSPEQQVV